MAENKIQITEDGGLLKQIIKEGREDGAMPPKGSQVKVHYVGKLLDGTVFDSSRDRGEHFEFTIGSGHVIKGWDLGVATMKEGEIAILTCAPEYAYGARGSPPKIPPNSTLEFEVELVSFHEKEKEEWEMSFEEKLQSAEERKEFGTAAFKTGDLRVAKEHYNKAAKLVRPENVDTEDEEAKKKAFNIHVACLNNAALCYTKLKKYRKAIKCCDELLKVEPTNVKGLFRKGQAHLLLDEFDSAEQILQTALAAAQEQKSSDAEIKAELVKLTKRKMEYEQNSKKMFAAMFK